MKKITLVLLGVILLLVASSQAQNKNPLKEKIFQPWQPEAFTQIFSKNIELTVPLSEIVLLVIFVNIFALFKKARLIMAISYLFCLKWVFWSNYAELLKQSNTVTIASGCVFVFCGFLTTVLFCLDRFNSGD